MAEKRTLKIEYIDMSPKTEWPTLPAHMGSCLKPGESLIPGDIQRAIRKHCINSTFVDTGYDNCVAHWRRDMHADGSIVPQPGPTPRDDLIKACPIPTRRR